MHDNNVIKSPKVGDAITIDNNECLEHSGRTQEENNMRPIEDIKREILTDINGDLDVKITRLISEIEKEHNLKLYERWQEGYKGGYYKGYSTGIEEARKLRGLWNDGFNEGINTMMDAMRDFFTNPDISVEITRNFSRPLYDYTAKEFLDIMRKCKDLSKNS